MSAAADSVHLCARLQQAGALRVLLHHCHSLRICGQAALAGGATTEHCSSSLHLCCHTDMQAASSGPEAALAVLHALPSSTNFTGLVTGCSEPVFRAAPTLEQSSIDMGCTAL